MREKAFLHLKRLYMALNVYFYMRGSGPKHIVSLYDMCFADSVSYEESVWDEKITDSLNYLFLLKAVVKEGNTNKQD